MTTLVLLYVSLSQLLAFNTPAYEETVESYCANLKGFQDGTSQWPDGIWDGARGDGIDFVIEKDASLDKIKSIATDDVKTSSDSDIDCRRVRRSWNSMSTDERSLYIDGFLEVRKNGELNMDLDDYVAIATVHEDFFGAVVHHDSDYLFWHGYLVWELESRIRALGGRWECFGMPFWDFSHEFDHDQSDDSTDFILQTGLGGIGDPNDNYRVNGYSWDVSTEQFWTPYHQNSCAAEGDECPVCSLKRDPNKNAAYYEPYKNAAYYGSEIASLSQFEEFQPWVAGEIRLPPYSDNSYDPIWFIYHSMQSYYHALWVNCHGYHLIDPDELVDHPDAFAPYCETDSRHTADECVGIDLFDPLYFGGLLPKRPWAYIHDNDLTIQSFYYQPQWNVVYDLNDDDFFAKSGLAEQCSGGPMSEDWFILLDESSVDIVDDQEQSQQTDVALFGSAMSMTGDVYVTIVMLIVIVAVFAWRKRAPVKSKAVYVGYAAV